MRKLRMIYHLLIAQNYIVITNKINDGHVEPPYAGDYYDQLQPVVEMLRQLARAYTMESSKNEQD